MLAMMGGGPDDTSDHDHHTGTDHHAGHLHPHDQNDRDDGHHHPGRGTGPHPGSGAAPFPAAQWELAVIRWTVVIRWS